MRNLKVAALAAKAGRVLGQIRAGSCSPRRCCLEPSGTVVLLNLEQPRTEDFFRDAQWQGLKPILFRISDGPTKVVP
jgi:hypothetical protein